MAGQPGFFDTEVGLQALSATGDPLERLPSAGGDAVRALGVPRRTRCDSREQSNPRPDRRIRRRILP